MRVKVLSKNEWQSYPIIDGMIEVSEENLQAIRDGKKEFDSYGNIIEKSHVIEEPIEDDSYTDLSYLFDEKPVEQTEPTPNKTTSLPY